MKFYKLGYNDILNKHNRTSEEEEEESHQIQCENKYHNVILTLMGPMN